MVTSEQFPMFRLATLLARQLSAPVARQIKGYAKTHPRFSRLVCASTARVYREAELRFKLWSLRLARRGPVGARAPPLSDREAVEVGGDILGEAMIFALGAAIVVFEVNRQAAKQEAKALEQQSRWVALLVALKELQRELVLQQQDIDGLRAALTALAPPAPPTPATR